MRTSLLPDLAARNCTVFTLIAREGKQQQESDQKSSPLAWKQLKRQGQNCTGKGKVFSYQQRPAKGQKNYKSQFMCKLCLGQEKQCTCDRQVK